MPAMGDGVGESHDDHHVSILPIHFLRILININHNNDFRRHSKQMELIETDLDLASSCNGIHFYENNFRRQALFRSTHQMPQADVQKLLAISKTFVFYLNLIAFIVT